MKRLLKLQQCAVANFYYEIADVLVEQNLYKNKYYVSSDEIPNLPRLSLTMDSSRIWADRDGHVWYVKHRNGLPHETLVDMKEFMWIKLKAKEIK